MATIPPTTAKKLASIKGDFLAMSAEEQLVMVREIRSKRRKPAVVLTAKPVKAPKPPKPPKQPKVKKEKANVEIKAQIQQEANQGPEGAPCRHEEGGFSV